MTAKEAEAKGTKAGRLLGSLKDALIAAGRDETQAASSLEKASEKPALPMVEILPPPLEAASPAQEAARAARTPAEDAVTEPVAGRPASRGHQHIEPDAPPTTRVLRSPKSADEDRTVLVRGRHKISRGTFDRDPVVGFLVVVGGPGLGQFRPVFEGNNTIGRNDTNRIALDFGDDTISGDAQAYLRYDSADRSFLFVPNMAKTNVVSVNDKRPTSAVEIQSMDVITLGRTQVAFVPFCGADFDWSEISEDRT